MTEVSRIAIDGPAASGKSTLAQRLASHLRYLYLDTGVMYRAVTLAALRSGVPVGDETAVTELAGRVSIDVRPATVGDGRQYDVLLDGEDVTWAIRSPEVDAHVSQVSMYAGVREAMGRLQHEIGRRGHVVMVGRDIGTVILPDADLKIYLDASVEERARRRFLECRQRGQPQALEDILHGMRERDRLDSTRDLAPLKPATEALVVDTTDLTIEQMVARALEMVERAGSGARNVHRGRLPGGGQGGSGEGPLGETRVEGGGSVHIPCGVRLFRGIGRPAFRFLFRVLCRIRIEGLENIPKEGGYLVSGNHLSIIDPPFVVAFWPRPLEAVGAVEVLERPFQGQLMRLYGAMSVHRGQADRGLLDEMVRRLRAGFPVLMDPEGRRSHVPGMQTAHPGVAYVAARARVPVIPVGVTGSEAATAAWKRGRRGNLKMVIGKPVVLPEVELRSPARRARLRANTDILMREIAALLPEEYRGVYR